MEVAELGELDNLGMA